MSDAKIFRHAEMKWPEFEEFVKRVDFSILPVAAIEQPVTLVNFWGALLATRYLAPYGTRRQAIRFSRALSGDYASVYLALMRRLDPTPVATIGRLKSRIRNE